MLPCATLAVRLVRGPPVAEDDAPVADTAGAEADSDTDTDTDGTGAGGADEAGADEAGAEDAGADEDEDDLDGLGDLDGEGDPAAEDACDGDGDAGPDVGSPADADPRSPSSGALPPSRCMAGSTPGTGAGPRAPAEGPPAGAPVEALVPVGPVSGGRWLTALGAGS